MVTIIVTTLLLMAGAYLLGSVPFSYLVARTCGVDLRTIGSGNIGAANVWRSCGFVPFLISTVLDILKGSALPFLAVVSLGLPPFAVICIGACAMLGHTFSLFMKFKGGKAVATSGGVLLVIFPLGVLFGALAWVAAFALTRISAVGSLTAAATVVVVTVTSATLGLLDIVYAIFTCVAAALVVFLHRANIQRLRTGTENRFQKLF